MKRILNNNSGSTLLLVMLVTLVLSISLLGFANTTIGNTKKVQADFQSDKAYLAARSGYEIMKSLANEAATADKIRASRGMSAITMDLDNVGKCDVKVYTEYKKVQATNPITGYPVFESDGVTPVMTDVVDDNKVKIECLGKCDGNEYMLTRYLQIVDGTSPTSPIFTTKAYTQYGDMGTETDPMKIDGGVQGDILILGDGYLYVVDSGLPTPMHKVICLGNLDLSGGSGGGGSDNTFELIATGGHCILPGGGSIIETDVLVGLKDRLTDSDPTNDPYFEGTNALIYGNLKCEGDITTQNCRIGLNPDGSTDPYDGYISQLVMFSGGDIQMNGNTDYVFGSIVCAGDITINNTAYVYGDIICNGNVTINSGATIYGTVYAKGTVTVTTWNNDQAPASVYAGASANITINSGYTAYSGGKYDNLATGIALNPPTFASSDAGTELGNKILYYFYSDIDWVSADDYITDEVASAPQPYVQIPSKFSGMDPLQLDVTTTTTTCWWCTEAPYYSSYSHTPHEKTESSLNTSEIVIDSDCVIDQVIGWNSSNWAQNKIYIDASSNDVDILIKSGGGFNVTNFSAIYVNDGGGAHKIRLFMEDGSTLALNSAQTDMYAIRPVSDSNPNASIGELSASICDPNKIPQLYLFAENDAEANLVMNCGYFPGYVIAASLNFTASGTHHYTEYTDSSGTTKTELSFNNANVPYFYGMLVCDKLDFSSYRGTWIIYDERLSDTSSATYAKFQEAIDGIIYYIDS